MKKVGLVVLLVLLLFISCSRKEVYLDNVVTYPVVIASYWDEKELAYLNEALALMIFSNQFELDEVYEVTLTSPSKQFSWHFKSKAVEVADLKALVKNDLLIPTEFSLESGLYKIEILFLDGQLIEETFTFNRPSIVDKLLFEVAIHERPSLAEPQIGWTITKIEEENTLIATYFDTDSQALMIIRDKIK